MNAAGIRIEPPPSDAVPNGMIPAATAAAVPPLEPPGRAARVPRVAGDAVHLRLGEVERAELGRRGLADRDRARGLEASDVDVVLGLRTAAGERHRAVVGRHALAPLEVLHAERARRRAVRDRHPAPRLRRPPTARVTGEVGVEVHERVQPLVARLDPPEVLVQHLHRLALASAHGFGQLDDSGLVTSLMVANLRPGATGPTGPPSSSVDSSL